MDQETFDRLCDQFDPAEELSSQTLRYEESARNRYPLVTNFDSLLKVENLKSLEIDNMVLRQDEILTNLSDLSLRNPSNETLQNFYVTSRHLANLNKLSITSSYNTECSRLGSTSWPRLFDGVGNLGKLNTLRISRETRGPYQPSGGGGISATIGGAGIEEITSDIITKLAQTRVNNLFLDGFIAAKEIEPRTRTYNYSKYFLGLINQERERATQSVNLEGLDEAPGNIAKGTTGNQIVNTSRTR